MKYNSIQEKEEWMSCACYPAVELSIGFPLKVILRNVFSLKAQYQVGGAYLCLGSIRDKA